MVRVTSDIYEFRDELFKTIRGNHKQRIMVVGSIVRKQPDACGVIYSFKLDYNHRTDNGEPKTVILEQQIRIDYDEHDKPEDSIRSNLMYIQDELRKGLGLEKEILLVSNSLSIF